jgi:hypothetical protein
LRAIEDEIAESGAKLVVIGNGQPEQAVWFSEDTGFEGELYTDPSLKTYRLLGMKSGMLTALNPMSTIRGMKAFSEGFRQTRTMGHAFQQGGVLIVRPDGSIPYRYISDSAGDHPDPQDILAALR